MKLLAGLFFAAVATACPQESPQQSPPLDSWHTVQRMCGVVERTQHVPRKHSAQLEEKKAPFRYLSLELYAQQGSMPCCEKLVLAGQAKTDEDGRYRFKKIAPGDFWLSFQMEGRRYSYPLRYQPAKHADPDCDWFYLNFDEADKVPFDREMIIE